jgi:hypothetical protein
MENLICQLCGYKSSNWVGFSNHIKYKHVKKNEINSLEEYYQTYLMINSNNPIGNCLYCGKRTKFISISKGYARHCNHECSCKNEEIRKIKYENMKTALIEKYGVDNAGKIYGYSDKVKKTKKERYGDENYNNPIKNKETNLKNHNGKHSTGTIEYKEKYKKTVKEKYGVEHHTQSDIVKEHNKSTCRERYGVDYAQQNKEIKQKGLDTNQERYGGVLHGSNILSKKIKETMVERYGVEYSQQNKDIQEKTKKTNLERYGWYYTLQNRNILQRLYGVNDINELDWVVNKQKEKRKETLSNKYQVENISQLQWVQDIIKKHNIEKYGVESTTQLEWVKDKMKSTCFEKYGVENFTQSDEYKQINIEKYGVEHPMQNEEFRNKVFQSQSRKSYRVKDYILPNGDIIKYQSKMELAFIEDCINCGIEIQNGDKIPYYDNNGKKHYYFVDFKIKEDNKYRLVEIKGTTKWYYESIESGILINKVIAAQQYSEEKGYLPFKIEINYEKETK